MLIGKSTRVERTTITKTQIVLTDADVVLALAKYLDLDPGKGDWEVSTTGAPYCEDLNLSESIGLEVTVTLTETVEC